MDKNRLFVIGAMLAMAVIILLGWTLGVQPQFAATVTAVEETKAVQAQNAAQADVLAVLKKDYANLGTLQKERDELRKAVPAGTDMSAFIDELHAVVVARGVTLGSFAVTEAQAYVAPKAAPPAAGTPPAAGAAAAAPAPAAEQAPDGLVLMPIQLTVKGPYAKVLDFVHGLQTGTRLVLVTTLTTSQPAGGTGAGQEVTASVGGFAYVLTTPQPGSPAP